MTSKRLGSPAYKSWIKSVNGLLIVKNGILKFTDETARKFHEELKKNLGQSPCTSNCSKASSECAVCKKWSTEIKKYCKGVPTWNNTKPYKRITDYWEVAKIYMGKGQDKDDKSCPDKMDTSALLQLISNNSFFIDIYQKDKEKHVAKIKEVINWRNKLLHSADQLLEDADLVKSLDDFIAVLKIPCFQQYAEAVQGAEELEELKGAQFVITDGVEFDALRSKMQEIELLVRCSATAQTPAEASAMSGALKTGVSAELSHQQIEELEKKFNAFLAEYEDLGELRVELVGLERRVRNLELKATSGPDQSGEFDPARDANIKSVLNHMAQDKGWKVTYACSQPDYNGFKCTVDVNGEEFVSPRSNYRTKKEAEQHAAFEAVKHFRSVETAPAFPVASSGSEICTRNDSRTSMGSGNDEAALTRRDSGVFDDSNMDLSVASEVEDVQSGVQSGSNMAVLAQYLRSKTLLDPVYMTQKNTGRRQALIELSFPHLWTIQNPVLGKKAAEQQVAKLICQELGVQGTSSFKEKLYVHCGKNGMAPAKYYSYNAEIEQMYYGAALFMGVENPGKAVFKSKLCESDDECKEDAAGRVLEALKEFNLYDNSEQERLPTHNLEILEQNSLITNLDFDIREINGQFSCTVSFDFPRKISHDPDEKFTNKKEAEKALALKALQTDFDLAAQGATLLNAKNKLQEECVKINRENLPVYSGGDQNSGFQCSLSYTVMKFFQSQTCESEQMAKREASKLAYDYVKVFM